MTGLILTLTFLAFVLMQMPLLEARWDLMDYKPLRNTNCDYTGYAPGGNKVTIQRITSPTAKLEKGLFTGLAGNLGKTTNGAMHLTNLAKGFGKLANIAPKLGPALGVFGVGMSIVKGFTDPTPQDILDAANKAISKLTTEVNNRLDEMKGYVEQKTINLEKDLNSRKYATLFRFWGNCLKETTEEKVNECQEDAAKNIMAARSEFAIFSTNVEANTPNMPIYDVKRIEAGLLVFRQYVILNLAALSTMVATYKDVPGKSAEYLRYANDLNSEIMWSVKYVENAVSIILDMHTRGDNCADTLKVTPIHHIYEGGWIKVNTADSMNAECLIDRADVPTRTCGYYLVARADGHYVSSYTKIITPTTSRSSAMKYKLKELVRVKASTFMEKMRQTIETYWENEILDLVQSWKELRINLPQDQILSEDEVMERRRSYGFSNDYSRRYLAAHESRDERFFDDNKRYDSSIARNSFDARKMFRNRFDTQNMARFRFDRRKMIQDNFGNMGQNRYDTQYLNQDRFDIRDMNRDRVNTRYMNQGQFDSRGMNGERFDTRYMNHDKFDNREDEFIN